MRETPFWRRYQRLFGSDPEADTRDESLNTWYRQTFPDQRPDVAPVTSIDGPRLDTVAVIERAASAPSGDRFALLWDGQWEAAGKESASDGDWEFCCLLVEAGATCMEQIVEIVRLGNIYRKKWDRADYQRSTAGGALAKVQQTRTALAPLGETWVSLRDLLDRPELLKPPEPIVPRLAYRARATLLAAPDKSGKTTLATHAVAALTRGAAWLDATCVVGRCVWCGLDEALGDTVRRFGELKPDRDADRVRMLVAADTDLLRSLDAC